MRFLDLTLPTPAENLACDEALLEFNEQRDEGDVLRFWESDQPMIVMGYSNKTQTEVNLDSCQAARIPVFRRCSGGGTVLLAPGCLNYSLILNINKHPKLNSIIKANQYIMSKNCDALAPLLDQPAKVRGITDLAVDGLKVSGNSQRRKKNYLLFHGTFLFRCDLQSIGRFLNMPSREPDYRKGRSHTDFLKNLPLDSPSIKSAMIKAWQADQPLLDIPAGHITALVREKYSRKEWNYKY